MTAQTGRDLRRAMLLAPPEELRHFARGRLEGRDARIGIEERAAAAPDPVVLQAQGSFSLDGLADLGRDGSSVGLDVRGLRSVEIDEAIEGLVAGLGRSLDGRGQRYSER